MSSIDEERGQEDNNEAVNAVRHRALPFALEASGQSVLGPIAGSAEGRRKPRILADAR
jgi:hypothetical protein